MTVQVPCINPSPRAREALAFRPGRTSRSILERLADTESVADMRTTC